MSLPTVADLRDRLRIETTAEDTLLQTLLDTAYATIQAFLRRPIGLELFSVSMEAPLNANVVSQRRLVLPIFPIGAPGDSAANYSVSQAIELTDGDGTVVPTTDYRIDASLGIVFAEDTFAFDTWPYTCVFAAGLGARADYDQVEITIGGAILDLAMDYYQRRNPAASSENTGGGISTQYHEHGIPLRVENAIKRYRMARVLG